MRLPDHVDMIVDEATGEVCGSIPRSIRIVTKSYGHALESVEFVPIGAVVYTATYRVVPNSGETHTLRLKNTYDESELTFSDYGTFHTVQAVDGETRQLYWFDGCMNHSCNPNTRSSTVRSTSDAQCFEYDRIAIRDIHVGDELTCNYCHFDYECDASKNIRLGGNKTFLSSFHTPEHLRLGSPPLSSFNTTW